MRHHQQKNLDIVIGRIYEIFTGTLFATIGLILAASYFVHLSNVEAGAASANIRHTSYFGIVVFAYGWNKIFPV